MEKNLVAAAIKSREAFLQLAKLDPKEDLSPMGRSIWDAVCAYYDADETAQQIDIAVLKDLMKSTIPNQKHRTSCEAVVDELDPDVSAPNVVTVLRNLRLRNIGYEIAARVGSGDIEQSSELMEKFLNIKTQEVIEEEDILNDVSVTDLVKKMTGEAIIPIAPKALAAKIGGGIIRGQHVVVIGRPNAGKSAFVINTVAVALRAGFKVLFIENEDAAEFTLSRLISRLTDMPREQIFADPQVALERAREQGYRNFYLKELSPGTYREIGALVDKYKPDLLILNQIRNFSMGTDSRPEQLEKAAIQARNIGKKYKCGVISVTQAGDSATNKLYPTMEDTDNSKTGISGACDLFLAIGSNQELRDRSQMNINIAKSKNNVHEAVLCKLEPHLSRITGV